MNYAFLVTEPMLLPYVIDVTIDSLGEAPLKAKEIYESKSLIAPILLIDINGKKVWGVEHDVVSSDSNNQYFTLVDNAYQGFIGTRESDYVHLDSITSPSITSSGPNSYLILTQKDQFSPISAIGFNDSSFSAAVSVSVNSVDSSDTNFNPKLIVDTTNGIIKRVVTDSDGYYVALDSCHDTLVGMNTPDSYFLSL